MGADSKEKAKKLRHRRRNRFRLYYSFLSVVLIFCTAYFCFSAYINVRKCIDMPLKVSKMLELNTMASMQNKKLKDEISNFESLHSLEAIARNSLKMAGKDEILVIVSKNQNKDLPKN